MGALALLTPLCHLIKLHTEVETADEMTGFMSNPLRFDPLRDTKHEDSHTLVTLNDKLFFSLDRKECSR